MLLAATALLVSACSPGSSTTAATADSALAALPSSTPSALSPYYGQKLTWRTCGVPGFECATMKAPLDYAKPASGDIRLAVSRKKATGPGKRLGSLLVNPGGPGGSAVGYLQAYAGIGYPAEVRARYDMVAVDPRGVARSEPVECLTGREMDTYTQTDTTPDDGQETDQLVDAYKQFAEGCGRLGIACVYRLTGKKNGRHRGHLDTELPACRRGDTGIQVRKPAAMAWPILLERDVPGSRHGRRGAARSYDTRGGHPARHQVQAPQ